MPKHKQSPAASPDTNTTPGTDPEAIDKLVGTRIRLRRKMLHMSQDNVASILGITFQQFQKYEIGESKVSASRLYMIAKILGVGMEYFYREFPAATTEPNVEDFFIKEDIVDPFDPMQSPAAKKLVTAFMRVGDEKKRQLIMDFVNAMADKEPEPASGPTQA